MKIGISEDQNTLTVDGIEYEAKLNNARPHQSSCLSCVFYDKGFCEIAMKKPVGVNASDLRRCEWPYRRDMRSIFWTKKEVEQDDKKAIAIFSDDEKVLKISGHDEHDGIYEAKRGFNCDNCFFGKGEDKNKCDYDREILGSSRCNSVSRKDTVSIFWVKKEAQQMTEAPAPALQHRHFDLIVQWAKNPTQPVWFWNVNEWQKAEYVVWHMEHYAIGDKPTEPPVKMVKYDGGSIEFPEPARVKLESGKDYWQATIYGANKDYWSGHVADYERLETGLVQLTKEGAEKQSEALVELLRNHTQKWG